MKPTLNLLAAMVAVAGLAGCAAPQSPNQLSQKTVNYQCGPGGQDPLTVQYTFQGRDAVSARIIYQNQVVLLPRSTATNVDMVGNTFRSDNYTWITQAFDYDSVDSARGDMLTREIVPPATPDMTPPVVNGHATTGTTPVPHGQVLPPVNPAVNEVSNIVVRDCVPLTTTTS